MSRFFIDRPIFAWVIALVIMLAGALSILTLPVNQYPSIAPPAVGISVTYPGASAQTVQDTVVQVIEQQLNGHRRAALHLPVSYTHLTLPTKRIV